MGAEREHLGVARARLAAAGRRTVDVLHQASGPQLVALFSPEHGLDAVVVREKPNFAIARAGTIRKSSASRVTPPMRPA